MSDDGALRFAEQVVALVDSGRKSATYKLATLLALMLPRIQAPTASPLLCPAERSQEG